jgi:hypothetical protein
VSDVRRDLDGADASPIVTTMSAAPITLGRQRPRERLLEIDADLAHCDADVLVDLRRRRTRSG